MEAKNRTINEMIAQMITEARKRGYSEAAIGRKITPKLQTVAAYYEKRGVCFYDPQSPGSLLSCKKNA